MEERLKRGDAKRRRGSRRSMLIEGESKRGRCSVENGLKKGRCSVKERLKEGDAQ